MGEGEDSIISARLVQFVTPAVVFNQPPRAACTANSLIISLSLSLSPSLWPAAADGCTEP